MTLQITRIFVSDVGFDNIYAEKKTKKKEKTKDVKKMPVAGDQKGKKFSSPPFLFAQVILMCQSF